MYVCESTEATLEGGFVEFEVCAGLSLKCLSRGLCVRLSEMHRLRQAELEVLLEDVNWHPAARQHQ